jgi:hypothetical protein
MTRQAAEREQEMTHAAHDAEEALDTPEDRRPARPITFTVDGETVQTRERRLTPNQILGLDGIDPASHYLVQVKGRQQISYQGKGDEPITVHEHAVFVSVSTGPTPTS